MSSPTEPRSTSVGMGTTFASGSIIGLAGYLAAMSYLQPSALPKSVRTSILTTIGLAAYLGAFGFFFIDNAAHAGGLEVVPWTANKPEDWARLVDAGSDAIISDDPAALITWLQSKSLR